MCATSNDQNIRRAPLKKENKVFMLISHSYGGRKRNFNILTHMLADGQIRLVLQFVKVLQIHDSEECFVEHIFDPCSTYCTMPLKIWSLPFNYNWLYIETDWKIKTDSNSFSKHAYTNSAFIHLTCACGLYSTFQVSNYFYINRKKNCYSLQMSRWASGVQGTR